MTIAHIINPVQVSPKSDLYIAQPITFQSLLVAKEFAKTQLSIALYTAQFDEDKKIIPAGFCQTDSLTRSILDLQKFKEKKKLPLLKDILFKLYENSQAEYFIYSNVDIGVMPHFYLSIKSIIELGYDCFSINRRDLPNVYDNTNQLPLIYSAQGKPHPGHDCFVFKKAIFEKFVHCEVCLGMPNVGKYILFNLLTFAKKMKVFEDSLLTFHLGSDRIWQKPIYSDFREFNSQEIRKMLTQLLRVNKEILANRYVQNYLKTILSR